MNRPREATAGRKVPLETGRVSRLERYGIEPEGVSFAVLHPVGQNPQRKRLDGGVRSLRGGAVHHYSR